MISALTPLCPVLCWGKPVFRIPENASAQAFQFADSSVFSRHQFKSSISKDAYDHSEYSHQQQRQQQQQQPQPQPIPINTVFHPIFFTKKKTPVFFSTCRLVQINPFQPFPSVQKMHPRDIFTAILRPCALKQNHALDVHCPWHFKPCIPKSRRPGTWWCCFRSVSVEKVKLWLIIEAMNSPEFLSICKYINTFTINLNISGHWNLPARELAYPTLGRGKSSTQECQTVGDMLVPSRVS